LLCLRRCFSVPAQLLDCCQVRRRLHGTVALPLMQLFKQLMKRDSADYGHLVAPPAKGRKGGSHEAEAPDSNGNAGVDVASPGGEGGGDEATPEWMDGLGKLAARAGATGRGGRGRGGRSTGRGGRGGRSAGRGRGSTGGRKRKPAASSEEEDDSDGMEGDNFAPIARAASTRKRLPMTK
jgi:hypothetical protein